jgi:hypothetical protein
MDLRFQVKRQKMTRLDGAYIVSDSKNYLCAEFSFSEDWEGKIKTAIFEQGNTVYHVVLENDRISAEKMPVFSAGVWKVSVFGGDLMTADSVSLPVHPSGFRKENAPEPPEPSVYESLTALIQENITTTEELKNKITDSVPLAVEGETLVIG